MKGKHKIYALDGSLHAAAKEGVQAAKTVL